MTTYNCVLKKRGKNRLPIKPKGFGDNKIDTNNSEMQVFL